MEVTNKTGWLARSHPTCLGIPLAAAALALGAWPEPAQAAYPQVELDELAHTADAIFTGTVTDIGSWPHPGGRMIFTDVTFDVITLIHAKAHVDEDFDDGVTLTFAGGEVQGRRLSVSDSPTFALGERYLIFTRLDGGRYLNPIIGGPQGLFRLDVDEVTGLDYPVTPGGHAIGSVTDGRLRPTTRIEGIADGTGRTAVDATWTHPAPRPGDAGAGPARSLSVDDRPAALSLEAFTDEIRAVLGGPPPANPALRLGAPAAAGLPTASVASSGDGDEAPAQEGMAPLHPQAEAPAQIEAAEIRWPSGDASSHGGGRRGADLGRGWMTVGNGICGCGSFDLFLVMQQVPEEWWSWWENNDAMWMYNQFMDIYRYIDTDGSWGNNGTNEFAGWPSDADLQQLWGVSWNGRLAITLMETFWCVCCDITQADVAFNPAYAWTDDFSYSFQNSDVILYKAALVHELGHTWGLERGDCNEDYMYDFPSVMHGYSASIVEDGLGIHAGDALMMRDLYAGQTSILPTVDVGIESYYANGLRYAAFTDSTFYDTGDAITIYNLTAENMSSSTLADVRIRLWLSTNKIISEGDYQMGSYWYFDTLSAESYWSGELTTTVPDVPTGTYYVGLMISIDGTQYAGDDLWQNNATFLGAPIIVTGAASPNDSCADAFTITEGLTFFDTTDATTDGLAHAGCQFGGQTYNDIWYDFTATCSGTLTVTTCEDLGGWADYDTDLVVYEGCSCNSLALLGCNDDDTVNACGDFPDYQSTVQVPVTAGGCYKIRVGGYGSDSYGTGSLSVTCDMSSCLGDLDFDGVVATADVLMLLGEWNSTSGSPADLDGDGIVATSDLLLLLGAWGPCP